MTWALFTFGWLTQFCSNPFFVFSALTAQSISGPGLSTAGRCRWAGQGCTQAAMNHFRVMFPRELLRGLWLKDRQALANLNSMRVIRGTLAIFCTFKIWHLGLRNDRKRLSSGNSSQKPLKTLISGRSSGMNPLHPPSIYAPFASWFPFLEESFWLAYVESWACLSWAGLEEITLWSTVPPELRELGGS